MQILLHEIVKKRNYEQFEFAKILAPMWRIYRKVEKARKSDT